MSRCFSARIRSSRVSAGSSDGPWGRAEATESTEKRAVSELHIGADEAHVTLIGGKKSIVPLVSVYEGIETIGKRKSRKNVFHISEYGKNNLDSKRLGMASKRGICIRQAP